MLYKHIAKKDFVTTQLGGGTVTILAQDIGDITNTPGTVFVVSTHTNAIYRSGVSFDLAKKYGPAIYDNYLGLINKSANFGDIDYVPGKGKTPPVIYVRTVPLNTNETNKITKAITNAIEKTLQLVSNNKSLKRIIFPLIGSSVTSGLSPEDSLKIILQSIQGYQEKLKAKEIVIVLRRSRQPFLQKVEEIIATQNYAIKDIEKDSQLDRLLNETSLREVITKYQVASRTSYMKDAFSILVKQNDNSTILTSGLGINWHISDQVQRKPIFAKKFNFRQLLTSEFIREKDNFQFKLLPYIRKIDGQEILHVRQIIYHNGQELENLEEHADIYRILTEKLAANSAPIDTALLNKHISEFTPIDFSLVIQNIQGLDQALLKKLELFANAHLLIQKALILKIRRYIQQGQESLLALPETVIIAAALEACLNEMLAGKGNAVRMIENITYIADYIFGQNITPEKLQLAASLKSKQPLAIIAEYFTLEDLLQLFQGLPREANLAFISAWEPDFISQENKRNHQLLRNDDTQELCELFGFGFYISDDTIANFNTAEKLLPETICILDGETFRNNQEDFFSETFFIMNQPEALASFIEKYTEIFNFSRAPENILDADTFHERNLLLSKLYSQLGRRLYTNFDNLDMMLTDTPQAYAQQLEEVFKKIRPEKQGILTEADLVSLNKVINQLIRRMLNVQKRLQQRN